MRRIAAHVLLVVAQALFTGRLCAADSMPVYIEAALADPGRPDADRQRDANRKPAEVIAFAGIKPGDKVADFMPGQGYFTRIFCKVVGESGHVYAIEVPRSATAASAQSPPPPSVPPRSAAPAMAQPTGGQACSNVTASSLKRRLIPAPELHSDSGDPGWVYEYWSSSPAIENFAAPEPLDVIWTAESYHSLNDRAFGSPDMLVMNKALLAALRPGGMLVIEDHAVATLGARVTASRNRIATERVKREVTEAGFEFVGEIRLHRTDDRHTANTHDRPDEAEQFLLKFRKP